MSNNQQQPSSTPNLSRAQRELQHLGPIQPNGGGVFFDNQALNSWITAHNSSREMLRLQYIDWNNVDAYTQRQTIDEAVNSVIEQMELWNDANMIVRRAIMRSGGDESLVSRLKEPFDIRSMEAGRMETLRRLEQRQIPQTGSSTQSNTPQPPARSLTQGNTPQPPARSLVQDNPQRTTNHPPVQTNAPPPSSTSRSPIIRRRAESSSPPPAPQLSIAQRMFSAYNNNTQYPTQPFSTARRSPPSSGGGQPRSR